MRHLIAGLALMGLITTSAQADDPLVVKQSNHSVSVTLDRLAKILGDKGITVFARVDHAAGAKGGGQQEYDGKNRFFHDIYLQKRIG